MIKINNLINISNASICDMLLYSYTYSMEIEKLGNSIDEILVSILLSGIHRQMKAGLHEDYITKIEPLTTIKGKIDIHNSIKLRSQMSRKVYCVYDEYDRNNKYNQILKATCLYLIRKNRVKQHIRKKLRAIIDTMYMISDISTRGIKWETLSFTKDNASYKDIIEVCYIIHKGLKEDDITLQSYLDEDVVGDVYQRFINHFYQREFKNIDREYQGKYNIGEETAVSMKNKLTVDTIFTYDKNRVIMNNHYFPQLVEAGDEHLPFLIKELDRLHHTVKRNVYNKYGNVKGIMFYPSVDQDYIQKKIIEDKEIYLCAINLNKSFVEIENDLFYIVHLLRDED